jgi:hypothetical protein
MRPHTYFEINKISRDKFTSISTDVCHNDTKDLFRKFFFKIILLALLYVLNVLKIYHVIFCLFRNKYVVAFWNNSKVRYYL